MKTDKKEQKLDTPNPLCERVLETQDTRGSLQERMENIQMH